MKIGLIVLGNMGGHMAANLAAAGHEVTGYDPVAAPAVGRRAASDAWTADANFVEHGAGQGKDFSSLIGQLETRSR